MFPQKDLLPNQYLLPLRMILKMKADPSDLIKDSDIPAGGRKNILDFGNCIYKTLEQDPVSSFHSLLTHETELLWWERLELAVTSLLLEECLVSLGFLKKEEALQQELCVRMFRYQARVRCNGHQVDRVVTSPGESMVEVESVGSAVFPLLPLLNHSCDHNTVRVFNNNQLILLATR